MNQPTKLLYEFGGFRLDTVERLLLHNEDIVHLPPKAIDVLLVLIERRGHLIEKEELMKSVWPDTFVEEANLSYNISLIRKALGNGGVDQFIETVPKRGYRFVAEVCTNEAENGQPSDTGIGRQGNTGKEITPPRSRVAFSLGVLLYKMLSKQKPFQGNSLAETMAAIANEEPPELPSINSKVSALLERILKRCLEKQPERRFQSASELGFALEALSIPSGSQPNIAAMPAGRWRLFGNSRLAWGITILAVLGLLATLPFVISYLRQTTPANDQLTMLSVNIPANTSLILPCPVTGWTPPGNQCQGGCGSANALSAGIRCGKPAKARRN